MKVGELVAGSGLPPREARALLAQVLQVPRERLVAAPGVDVTPAAQAQFAALVERRAGGMPLAYLLGVREFYSRSFRVTPAVLVPRPETELLVEQALINMRSCERPRVLDLGTGSGCIAITLALECPQARVCASDASAAALRIAADNAAALGAIVDFRHGDWYAVLAAGERFDAIVSNPPYIAAGDAHLAALAHEPALALTDAGDGLACLRRIIAGAVARLDPGGALLVEHGFDQGAAVRELFDAAGFCTVESVADLQGHPRVTLGRRRT